MSLTIASALLVFLTASSASATVVQKSEIIGGTATDYLICLPPDWTASKVYPTVLAFCGGAQDLGTAQYTMQVNWRAEAEKRGWVIIMPLAPGGQLFFEGGERIFPEFLDRMLRQHRLLGGKFQLAGRSNGGISAFRVAIAYPRYFHSITVYPGVMTEDDLALAARLKGIPIKMAFGELDRAWLQEGRSQTSRLNAMGVWAWLQVESGSGHGIESFTETGSARLFDLVEKMKWPK